MRFRTKAPKCNHWATGDSVKLEANLTLAIRASKVDFIDSLILLWKMWDYEKQNLRCFKNASVEKKKILRKKDWSTTEI